MQLLYSTYSGGDYVFEAYGKQLQGRVWGLGARVNNPSNFLLLQPLRRLVPSQKPLRIQLAERQCKRVGQRCGRSGERQHLVQADSQVARRRDGCLQGWRAADPYVRRHFPIWRSCALRRKRTVANFSNAVVRKYAAFDPTATLGQRAAADYLGDYLGKHQQRCRCDSELEWGGQCYDTADASGKLQFHWVGQRQLHSTPSKAGFTFTPASQAVTINGAIRPGELQPERR